MYSVMVLKCFCTTIQGCTAFILITGSERVFFVLFCCFISGSSACQFRPRTYTLCLIIFASTNWLVYNLIVSALALDFFPFGLARCYYGSSESWPKQKSDPNCNKSEFYFYHADCVRKAWKTSISCWCPSPASLHCY